MPEDDSRNKGAPGEFPRPQLGSGKLQAGLHGENSILELISRGAPLGFVLNKLCSAIDLQIGSVVSVILLADDAEHDLQTLAHGARRYGLHVFWSASIPLREETPLGSFEMYCCVPRTPTPPELRLIQQATYLATLAIRQHNDDSDFESLSEDQKGVLRRLSHEAHELN